MQVCIPFVQVQFDIIQLSFADKKQPTLKEAISKTERYSNSSQRHRELTTAVAKFLCKGMVPIHTVEKRDFINLLQVGLFDYYSLDQIR